VDNKDGRFLRNGLGVEDEFPKSTNAEENLWDGVFGVHIWEIPAVIGAFGSPKLGRKTFKINSKPSGFELIWFESDGLVRGSVF
jgi:hypothetical protein